VEVYWEVREPELLVSELVSPELALVDPLLRERLLAQSRLHGSLRAEPQVQPIQEPPVLAEPGGAQLRRGQAVAWALVTTSCAAALAITTFALARGTGRPAVAPPAPPVVAVVTSSTPPRATPVVDHRTEAQKLELAVLLRSPMRDPFSPAP